VLGQSARLGSASFVICDVDLSLDEKTLANHARIKGLLVKMQWICEERIGFEDAARPARTIGWHRASYFSRVRAWIISAPESPICPVP